MDVLSVIVPLNIFFIGQVQALTLPSILWDYRCPFSHALLHRGIASARYCEFFIQLVLHLVIFLSLFFFVFPFFGCSVCSESFVRLDIPIRYSCECLHLR